jgi:hypothetical protein
MGKRTGKKDRWEDAAWRSGGHTDEEAEVNAYHVPNCCKKVGQVLKSDPQFAGLVKLVVKSSSKE